MIGAQRLSLAAASSSVSAWISARSLARRASAACIGPRAACSAACAARKVSAAASDAARVRSTSASAAASAAAAASLTAAAIAWASTSARWRAISSWRCVSRARRSVRFLLLAQQRGSARLVGGHFLGEPRQLAIERADPGDGGGERGRGVVLRRLLLRLRGEDGLALLLEPRQRGAGIGGELRLAQQIGGELRAALGCHLARRGDAALLFLERLARQQQALQLGAGGGFALAQRGELARRRLARALGGERRGGVLGHHALGGAQLLGGGLELGAGRLPLAMQHHRLGAADVVGEPAIALRLARLLLEAFELGGKRLQHVVEPREIALGRLEAELRLVAPRMQPGDPCRLLEQAAALHRLGVDDGADAALADQRHGMGAAGDVGEEQLHVAGAHLPAVDAIARALAALDAAHHLDLVILVVMRRRRAGGVVEMEGDLGDVARRPRGGAAEDDVVHLAAAHALGRVLAHHPAQRLHQIGFAAAIGADDAGHPGFDGQLGGIDEGLETA